MQDGSPFASAGARGLTPLTTPNTPSPFFTTAEHVAARIHHPLDAACLAPFARRVLGIDGGL